MDPVMPYNVFSIYICLYNFNSSIYVKREISVSSKEFLSLFHRMAATISKPLIFSSEVTEFQNS